jgi:hypothetical protein
MPNYRDVDAGLRITTLEAKLAERDASLAARDAELHELRAELSGEALGTAAERSRKLLTIIAVAGVLASAVLGAVLTTTRAASARERAAWRETAASAEQARFDLLRRLGDAKSTLDACARQIDPAQQPPPAPYALFGGTDDLANIESALDVAARTASTCRGASGPKGTGRVRMIFNPLEGKIESAALDFGPFTGAPFEDCVVAPFRALHLDAFKGRRVTLLKEVVIK